MCMIMKPVNISLDFIAVYTSSVAASFVSRNISHKMKDAKYAIRGQQNLTDEHINARECYSIRQFTYNLRIRSGPQI